MICYKLKPNGVICIDTETGVSTFIPEDESNSDWIEYKKWLQAGNVPDPETKLEERKDITKAELHNIFKKKLKTGVLYNGNTFELELNDIVYLNSIVAQSTEITFPVQCFNNEKVVVELEYIDVQMLQKAAGLLYQACQYNFHRIWALIDASSTPSSISLEDGWPTSPYSVS